MLPSLDVSVVTFDISQYLGLWAMEETAFNAHWLLLSDGGLLRHLAANPQQKTEPARTKADVANLAQIEIRGTMTKHGSSLSEAGATTLIRREVRAAMTNPDIDGALILIESPGGTVAGTQELAEDLAALSAAKPTVTLYEDLGASAALWAGSMSRKVFAANDHTTVGSMGVYMGTYDRSGEAAMKGIKPVVFRTGDLKGAGLMGTEFSDAQKQMYMDLVNAAHEPFKASVQYARKLSAEQMAELSRGGVYSAKVAHGLGLIDGIRSYEAAVAELRGMVSPKRKRQMTDTNTAASLPELEKACVGADEKFLLGQLRRGSTLQAAQSDWMLEQGVRIEAMQKDLKARDGEITQLKADLDAEKAKKGGKFAALAETKGKDAGEESQSAIERFDALVAVKVKSGMPKPKAIAAVVRENKELHAAYLAEANTRHAS